MKSSDILSITEARKKIFDIADKIQTPGRYFTLTENGRARAVIMSAEEFESWAETMQVMFEIPNLKALIRKAKKEPAVEFDPSSKIKRKYEISDSVKKKRGKKS